jgi:hypothetical protein
VELDFGPIRAESEVEKPKRDRMRLARYYQLPLDSGEFESRAQLAILELSLPRQIAEEGRFSTFLA